MRLTREMIDESAELFVTSSRPEYVSVVAPLDGKVPQGRNADIRLRGNEGGEPNEAVISVRYGSSSGPILSSLVARSFTPLVLNLKPHRATISGLWTPTKQIVTVKDDKTGQLFEVEKVDHSPDTSGDAVASRADIAAIVQIVQAVWLPCGVKFRILETEEDAFQLKYWGHVRGRLENPVLVPLPSSRIGDYGLEPQPGDPKVDVTAVPDDRAVLLGAKSFVPRAINVFFVPAFGVPQNGPKGEAEPATAGVGFSAVVARQLRLPNPGVLVRDWGDSKSDGLKTTQMGRCLAHEIGHFLGLFHTNCSSSRAMLMDTWSRRMLMCPSLTPGTQAAAGDYRNNVGYGDGNSGVLITQKRIPQVHPDDECRSARRAILEGLW